MKWQSNLNVSHALFQGELSLAPYDKDRPVLYFTRLTTRYNVKCDDLMEWLREVEGGVILTINGYTFSEHSFECR